MLTGTRYVIMTGEAPTRFRLSHLETFCYSAPSAPTDQSIAIIMERNVPRTSLSAACKLITAKNKNNGHKVEENNRGANSMF